MYQSLNAVYSFQTFSQVLYLYNNQYIKYIIKLALLFYKGIKPSLLPFFF